MKVRTDHGPALLSLTGEGVVVSKGGRALSPAEAGAIELPETVRDQVELVVEARLAGYQVEGLPAFRGPSSPARARQVREAAERGGALRRARGSVLGAALSYLETTGPATAPEIAAGTGLRYQTVLPALHREAGREDPRVRQVGEGVGARWEVTPAAANF